MKLEVNTRELGVVIASLPVCLSSSPPVCLLDWVTVRRADGPTLNAI